MEKLNFLKALEKAQAYVSAWGNGSGKRADQYKLAVEAASYENLPVITEKDDPVANAIVAHFQYIMEETDEGGLLPTILELMILTEEAWQQCLRWEEMKKGAARL